jgi:hypothetical protein
MVAVYDYTSSQGEDLTIEFVYKEGEVGSATPVNLSNHLFRMDLAGPDGKVLSVMNNAALADADPYTPGNQADNGIEVTLGADGTVRVELPRTLTLPGGALYKYINANPPQRVFTFDAFVRDTANNKQIKILAGTITFERSITHWA